MKIAINASILGGNITGTGNAVTNTINNFDHTENITIYASEQGLINKHYKIVRIPQNTNPTFNKFSGLYRFFWNQYNLFKIGRNYDIVYCPTTHGSIFLNNQIITVLDLIVYQFPKIHPFQWMYYKIFLPIYISRSKAIIVISNSVKKDLLAAYKNTNPNKIIVVKCGYDHNTFNTINDPVLFKNIKLKYQITGKYFIAVGATFAHKNLEVIIEAFHLYRNRDNIDYKLIIAGGNSKYRKSLEQLVNKLQLSSYIKFLGYISNSELVSLYQNSLGLIYSSLAEGFGLPLIEAMACGCPVIASKIDVLQEVADDAALYFDPFSAESLYASINLSLDENKRAELIIRGKERIKEFSWKKAADEIYQTFKTDNGQI